MRTREDLHVIFRVVFAPPYANGKLIIVPNDLFLLTWSQYFAFQDGSISKEEFAYCWNNWIKKIVRPVSAFLVIDVQNDFISGSLAITNCPAKQDGAEVNSHDILVEQTIMRNKGHNKATTRLQPYFSRSIFRPFRWWMRLRWSSTKCTTKTSFPHTWHFLMELKETQFLPWKH